MKAPSYKEGRKWKMIFAILSTSATMTWIIFGCFQKKTKKRQQHPDTIRHSINSNHHYSDSGAHHVVHFILQNQFWNTNFTRYIQHWIKPLVKYVYSVINMGSYGPWLTGGGLETLKKHLDRSALFSVCSIQIQDSYFVIKRYSGWGGKTF